MSVVFDGSFRLFSSMLPANSDSFTPQFGYLLFLFLAKFLFMPLNFFNHHLSTYLPYLLVSEMTVRFIGREAICHSLQVTKTDAL